MGVMTVEVSEWERMEQVLDLRDIELGSLHKSLDKAEKQITTLRAQLEDAKAANTKLEQEVSQALQWLEKVISKAPHCTLRYDAEQFIKERKEATNGEHGRKDR